MFSENTFIDADNWGFHQDGDPHPSCTEAENLAARKKTPSEVEADKYYRKKMGYSPHIRPPKLQKTVPIPRAYPKRTVPMPSDRIRKARRPPQQIA